VPPHFVAKWLGFGLGLVSVPASAQPTPSVSGPAYGQPTREVTLPRPTTKALSAALELDFEGECLEHERLVADVERWLGVDLISHRVTVSVTGAERPELSAHFWLLVDEQRVSLRRFESFAGTCSELSASLSAAIALAVEALDLSEFPEPPPKPRPVLPAAKLTARAALEPDVPPEPAPERRRHPGTLQSAALGSQLVGGFGVAPAASVGLGLRGELGFARGIALHAGGNYLVMDTVPISDGTLAMRAFAGQLGACWGRENGDYRAQGCLDVWAGAMSGTPSNLARQSRQTLPWMALAPGAEVLFQRDRNFGMRLGAQLTFNLVRPSFEVLFNTRDETIDEQATPPLGFMVTLGVDWVLL
jgi:hypothetical protein